MHSFLQTTTCLVIINTFQVISGNPCFFWGEAQYFDGFCYMLSNTTTDWTTAKSSCESSFGHLANPASNESLEFLTDLFYTTITDDVDWWLGKVWNNIDSVWTSSDNLLSSSSAEGYCVKIAAKNKKLELPYLVNDSCSALNRFICERYVSDPCRYALPGGEYYDGSCYRFNKTRQYWNNALAACERDGALFAELPQPDLYSFAKTLLSKSLELHFKSAPNRMIEMADKGVTLKDKKSFVFYSYTCWGVKIFLCGAASSGSTSVGDPTPCRDSNEEYFEIDLWMVNSSEIIIKKCQQNGTCDALNGTQRTTQSCYPIKKAEISWSANFTVLASTNAATSLKWTSLSPMYINISRLTVCADKGPAIWYFGKLSTLIYIFLGAVNDTTGFRWMYSKLNMTQTEWFSGEPNGKGLENHLSWGASSPDFKNVRLNDMNGSFGLSWSLCQKRSTNAFYLVILPENKGDATYFGDCIITTEEKGVVYLYFTQILNTGEVTQYKDWTSNDRSCLFPVVKTLELSTMGVVPLCMTIASSTAITRSVLLINASQEVTVVLYLTTGSDVSSSLIFPTILLNATYFIVTDGSTTSLITLTSLGNDTIITIKLPSSLSLGNIINVGYPYGIRDGIITICLNSFESAQIEASKLDLSGTFISANKQIAVLTGNKAPNTGNIVSLDASLPLETLTWTYLVYCRVNDRIKVLSLFNGTSLTIKKLSPSSSSTTSSWTLNSGEFREAIIEEDELYVIESDFSHPFYVIKISAGTQSFCMTSLLPSSLEKQVYNLLIQRSAQTAYFISDFILDNFSCSSYFYNGRVTESCINSYTTPGNYHVQTLNGTGVKAAYTQSLDGEFCHPVGVRNYTGNKVTFSALNYLGVGISPNDACTPTTTTVTTTIAVTTAASSPATNLSSISTTRSGPITNISSVSTTTHGPTSNISSDITTTSGPTYNMSSDIKTTPGPTSNICSDITTVSRTMSVMLDSTPSTVFQSTFTSSTSPLASVEVLALSSLVHSQLAEAGTLTPSLLNTTILSHQQPGSTNVTSTTYISGNISLSSYLSSHIVLPELMSSINSDPPLSSGQVTTLVLLSGLSGSISRTVNTDVIQATSVSGLVQPSLVSNIQQNLDQITSSTNVFMNTGSFTASGLPVSTSAEMSLTPNIIFLDSSTVSNIQNLNSLTAISHLNLPSFSSGVVLHQNQSAVVLSNSSVDPIEATTTVQQSHAELVCVLCPCRYVYTKNMSSSFKAFLEKLSKSIEEDLSVNYREMSAFKRTKISVWDNRISSHVIGGSGVAILIGFIAFLMSSDVMRIVRFFCALRKTDRRTNVNS